MYYSQAHTATVLPEPPASSLITISMATITESSHSKPIQALTFPLQTEALVVQEPKADFTLTNITLDEVRPDEVLVEMKYSGICHTV